MGRFIQPDGICTAWKAALLGFGARQRQKDFCLCLAIRWSYPAVFPTRKNWRHFVPSPAQKKLRGRSQTLEAAAKWLGWPIQIRQILSAAGALRPSVIPPGFCEPSPGGLSSAAGGVRSSQRGFRPLVLQKFPHKLSHRQGALLGVRAAGKMAATAGIYIKTEKRALSGRWPLTLPSGGGDMRQHWYFRWQTGPAKRPHSICHLPEPGGSAGV